MQPDRTAPPALSLAEVAHAPTCRVCRGLGLGPNWLFNFLRMPGMAGGQSNNAGMWFAVACGACGGWGTQPPAAADEQDTASTSSGDSQQDNPDDFLRRDGDRWCFRFDDRSIPTRDSVGMRHLSRLIATPGHGMSCLELCAAESGPPPPTARRVSPDDNLTVNGGTGDAGQMIDADALGQYKSKLDELDEDIRVADDNNDLGRLMALRHTREMIAAEIVRSTGRGGRPRKVPDDAERARKSVSGAIHKTLRRIGEQEPALQLYLETALTIGGECVFTPGDTAS